MARPLALECRGITKTFGKVVANDQRSLELHEGEVLALLGENGAGKSTTIKILTGLLGADSGKVAIAGMPPKRPQTRKILGYCPEQPYFYDYLSGRELLSFYGRLVGLEGATLNARIQWALQTVHADKDWIDRRLRTYSKGMMQRVGLAQSILSKPELLILDEPTAGLNPKAHEDILEMVKTIQENEKNIVFLVSHNMNDIARIMYLFKTNNGNGKYRGSSKTYYLGFKAEKTIDDMCRDAMNWQTKNPNGYDE